MSTRPLSLSPIQVAASVLATLTGAVVASYLGIASTLVGAAVGSISSTVGTEVYRHYLGRTQERLGAVVAKRRPPGRTEAARTRAAAGQSQAGPSSRREAGTEAGTSATAETEILSVRRPWGAARPTGASGTSSQNGSIHNSPTEIFPSAANESQGVSAPAPDAEGSHGNGKRPRWLVPAAATVGAFLVAVIVITIFEVAVGKPLEAVVWNRHATGTTVGGTVSGKKTHPSPTGKATAPATPAARATPSSGAGVSTSPSPSSVPSSNVGPSPGGPANSAAAAAPAS